MVGTSDDLPDPNFFIDSRTHTSLHLEFTPAEPQPVPDPFGWTFTILPQCLDLSVQTTIEPRV